MTFSIDNLEGGCNNPLRKICLGKTLRITRVNPDLNPYIILSLPPSLPLTLTLTPTPTLTLTLTLNLTLILLGYQTFSEVGLENGKTKVKKNLRITEKSPFESALCLKPGSLFYVWFVISGKWLRKY